MSANLLKKIRPLDQEILAVILLLCLIFGATLFYFQDVFFNGLVFFHSDLFNSEFTTRSYFWKMLREGLFTPLFPYNTLSHPLLMNPHHKTLYPTNILFLFSDDPYRMAHWDYLLHYGIAALGWYFYFKILIQSRSSAFLSALILSFNGIVLGSHYRVEIASFAWVPWAVWSFLTIFETWDYRKALFTGLFFSLIFLGGNPELCIIAMLLSIFSLLFQTQSTGWFNKIRQVRRHFWIFFLIPVVAVLIMLPLLERAIQDVPLTARQFGFKNTLAFVWSESPTAILELPGRWLSRFFIDPEMINAPMSIQMAKNWYGNHSIGFFGAMCLLIGFASLLKDMKGKALFLICVLLWCFSMGPYNFIAKWSWGHFEWLQKFRYPGKVFRYFLILSAIPIALGVKWSYIKINQTFERNFGRKFGKKSGIAVFILIALVNIIQVILDQPDPYLSTLAEKLELPVFQLFNGSSFQDTRVLNCKAFLGQGKKRGNVDGRPLEVAMLGIGEAVESPVLGSAYCMVNFGSNYYDWLGITHLVAPHVEHFESLQRSYSILSNYNRIASNVALQPHSEVDPVEGFDVFQLDHAAGPSQALFSEYWYFSDLQQKKKYLFEENRSLHAGIHFRHLLNGYFPVQESIYLNEEGNVVPLDSNLKEELITKYGPKTKCEYRNPMNIQLSRFPIQISADLSMKIGGKSQCPGLLSIPWTAMSGWKLLVNGQHQPIVRVGDVALGVFVPQGQWKVELFYDPKYLGLTLLISFLTFTCVLALMVIALGRSAISIYDNKSKAF